MATLQMELKDDNMNLSVVLSDEFVAYSKNIAAIHERKKQVQDEMKAFYEEKKAELLELEKSAKKATEEFEKWAKEKELKDESKEQKQEKKG